MKKMFLVILVLGGLGFYLKKHNLLPWGPGEIANPVYMETRIYLEAGGRSFEGLMLVQGHDQSDCQRMAHAVNTRAADNLFDACPQCRFKEPECKPTLPARYAILFDNEPARLTYLSFSPGIGLERPYRVMTWGVTVDESDLLCNTMLASTKKFSGTGRCIKAERS